MRLCSLLVSCLSWSNPSLESSDSIVGLIVTSKRAYTKGQLSGLLLPVSLSLHLPLPTQSSTGDLPTWAGSSGPLSCGVTIPFLCVLGLTQISLCSPRVESLFPPVLWKYCNQIVLTFKVRFSGNSWSFCQILRLGSLTGSSELLQQLNNFFGIIVLQFVGYPPSRYGI